MSKSSIAYKQHYDSTTGKQFFISSKVNKQFHKLDIRLRELDIDPDHYVKFSFEYWESYAKSKGWNALPINFICSETAISKYSESSHLFGDADYLMHVFMSVEESYAKVYVRLSLMNYEGDYWNELEEWRAQEFYIMFGREYSKCVKANSKLWKLAYAQAMSSVARYYRVEYQYDDLEWIIAQVRHVNNAN